MRVVFFLCVFLLVCVILDGRGFVFGCSWLKRQVSDVQHCIIKILALVDVENSTLISCSFYMAFNVVLLLVVNFQLFERRLVGHDLLDSTFLAVTYESTVVSAK